MPASETKVATSARPAPSMLPVEGHRIPFLDRFASAYKATTFFNYENFVAPPLGIVGSVGFLYLLIILLRRNNEHTNRDKYTPDLLQDTHGHHHPDFLRGAAVAISQKGRYVFGC